MRAITFNRPNVLNALNRKTIEELGEILNAARADASVRVLILTGSGEKAFIAGADINRTRDSRPRWMASEFALFGQEIIHRLETIGKPSIAAINGFALGGGCELALACTMRDREQEREAGPAGSETRDYAGIRRVAAVAAAGGQRRGARIDFDRRNDYGGRSTAHWLRESRGGTSGTAGDGEAIAKKIIANAPLAVKYAMEAVERGMEMPQEEGLFLEATLFGLCCATSDMREGTGRFWRSGRRNSKGSGRGDGKIQTGEHQGRD